MFSPSVMYITHYNLALMLKYDNAYVLYKSIRIFSLYVSSFHEGILIALYGQ